MAGPTLNILPDHQLNSEQKVQLNNYIAKVGTVYEISPAYLGFSVGPDKFIQADPNEQDRPFLISVDDNMQEYEESSLNAIKEKAGYYPLSGISLSAGSNDRLSYLILGKMTCDLLEMFGGFANINGNINGYLKAEKIDGRIFDIEYSTDSGKSTFQIVDQVFMRHWLNHEKFTLIK